MRAQLRPALIATVYGALAGALVYADADTALTPLALKFLAAVAGLGGFLLVAHWLIPGGGMALPLPPHTTPRDGSDLLWAIVPALLGAGTGLLARSSQPRLAHSLARLGNPMVQTLAGTALFALLAAVVPLVRFSGHHELVHALRDYYDQSVFVRVGGEPPRVKDVVASNFAQISGVAHGETVAVMCAIDNLTKGAAGGAVQWMNRMLASEETAGLMQPAAGWT